ncbi:MAG: TMEM175 family protein [Patescibacteria group bacterium]
MKQERFENLVDGIFAIVMTLLVLEIRIPVLNGAITNEALLFYLKEEANLFLSYLLSFAVLFTYWRLHHYIASVLTRNINNYFTNINAVFLLFVALIPFSSHLLGVYSDLELAIAIYATNVAMLGITLYMMRRYAWISRQIANHTMTATEFRHGTIRIITPVISSLLAIPLSYWNMTAAFIFITFAILFNFSRRSSMLVDYVLTLLYGESNGSDLYHKANSVDY